MVGLARRSYTKANWPHGHSDTLPVPLKCGFKWQKIIAIMKLKKEK